VIGEVARANYPRENHQFVGVIGSELDRAWSLSNNQLAMPNATERSATEVNAVSSAGAVRLDYEKARVNRFVAGIAEVLWSLMCRYSTGPDYVEIVGPEGAEALVAFEASAYTGSFAFEFVPDSGDRLDARTRQDQILALYNLAANSPSLNRAELERELVVAHGLDPARFIKEPPPKEPEAPNISFRFGGEDMINPIAVAVMLRTNQVTPEEIKAAAMLIQDAMVKAATPQVDMLHGGVPVGPGGAPPVPAAPAPVTPPEPNEPILKRLGDGTRM
jgi:hypothetical protein